MLGAFKKREFGIVTYDVDHCIGCRYCEVACPFDVPKFEWAKAPPKIVKCELCNHRLAKGKQPACTEVCPRNAVIFGKREDLLREAHRRFAASPKMLFDIGFADGILPALAMPERAVPNGARAG